MGFQRVPTKQSIDCFQCHYICELHNDMGDNLSWVKQILHNSGNETNKVEIFVQYETNM